MKPRCFLSTVVQAALLLCCAPERAAAAAFEWNYANFGFGPRLEWTDGVVPYKFDPNAWPVTSPPTANQKTQFERVIRGWQKAGDINFIKRRNSDADYVTVSYTPLAKDEVFSVNFSRINKVGGSQPMWIHDWHDHTIMHEVGHALGMIHEHQRSDRKEWVTVHEWNAWLVAVPFNLSMIGNSDLRTVYDYHSIMHYSKSAFEGWWPGETRLVIEPKDNNFLDKIGLHNWFRPDGSVLYNDWPPADEYKKVGTFGFLSPLDVAGIRKVYGAPASIYGFVNKAIGPLKDVKVKLTAGNSLVADTVARMTLPEVGESPAVSEVNGSFSFSGLPHGSYVVTPELDGWVFVPPFIAVDLSRGETEGLSFQAFAESLAKPHVTFQSPADLSAGRALRELDSFSLEANSAFLSPSPVQQVYLALHDSSGYWYNWRTQRFESGPVGFNFDDHRTSMFHLVSGTGKVWLLSAPTLADGSKLPNGCYKVLALARDGLNRESRWTERWFTLDSKPPTFNLRSYEEPGPANDLSDTGGAVEDDASAVTIEYRVLDQRGNPLRYWNGTSWLGGTTVDSVPWLPTTVSGAEWGPAAGHSLPGRAQTTPGVYQVMIRARDGAGNETSNTLDVERSPFDPTIPILSIGAPVQDQIITDAAAFPALWGYAKDPETGLSSLNVYVLKELPGGGFKSWNGFAWVDEQTPLAGTLNRDTGRWDAPNPSPGTTYGLPRGADLPNGGYQVQVYAANNEVPTGTNGVTARFKVLVDPPGVTITAPAADTEITTTGPLSFTGTVTDVDAGVAGVSLFIRRDRDGWYWNGSAWQNGPAGADLPDNLNPGIGPLWACMAPLPQPSAVAGSGTMSNGTYTFIAIGIDNFGNTFQLDRSVKVDVFQSYQWGGGSGDWHTAANWVGGVVPPADSMAVISGGTVSLSIGSVSIAGLTLNGGELGSGIFNVTETMNWTGGSVAGRVNIATAARLYISGIATKYLNGYGLYNNGDTTRPGVLHNAGRTYWSGLGSIECQYGDLTNNAAQFINADGAQFYCRTNADFLSYAGGSFINAGYLRKEFSSGSTDMKVAFVNTGVIEPMGGKFDFEGGGIGGGQYRLVDMDSIEFSGGVHDFSGGATFTGPGRVLLSSGEIKLSPSVLAAMILTSGATLEMTGGTLSKNGLLSGGGEFRWFGGSITGTTETARDTRARITGDGTKYLNGYRFYNNGLSDGKGILRLTGDSVFDGAGIIEIQYGGALENDGILEFAGNASIQQYASGKVKNYGTLRKTSAGTSLITGASLEIIHGVLDVRDGVLALNGDHLVTDGSFISGSGRMRLDAGNLTVSGNIRGNGHLELRAGTLYGTHTLQSATMHWTGGTIAGATTIGSGATMEIEGPVIKTLYGYGVYNNGDTSRPGIIHNLGTTLWSGDGDLELQYGLPNETSGHFDNRGQFYCRTDARINSYAGGSVNNSGTFRKEAGSGATNVKVQFTNRGLVEVLSGKFDFEGGGSAAGAEYRLTSMDSVEFSGGVHSFAAGGVAFTGIGRALLSSGELAFAPVTPAEITLGTGTVLEVSGGTLSKLGNLSGEGLLRWTGGAISGTTVTSPATRVHITGAARKDLSGYGFFNNSLGDGKGILRLGGPTTFDGAGSIEIQYGGALENTGVMEMTANAEVHTYVAGSLKNTGTLRKTSSGNSEINSASLENTGILDVQNGVLVLNGTHTIQNGSSLLGAGRTRLNSGSLTMNGSIGGNGHFEFSAGELRGIHTISAGTFHWTGGSIHGVTETGAGAALEITGPATKILYGYGLYNNGDTTRPGILRNHGNAVWEGGGIEAQYGGAFDNRGTFQVRTAAPFSSYVAGLFTNSGALRIGAPLRVANFHTPFTQTATGTLYLEIAGPAAAEFDHLNVNGTATLGGTVWVTKLNGYAPAAGTSFTFLGAGSVTGTFSSLSGGFDATYTGNTATVRVLAGQTFDQWLAASGFTPAEIANPAISGPNADPDGDGRTNFFEYVHNTNPKAGTRALQETGIVQVGGQPFLTLKYRRYDDREAAGVTYTPQTGATLGNWGTAGIIEEVDPDAPVIPGSTACRCRVLIVDGQETFLRVKAAKP